MDFYKIRTGYLCNNNCIFCYYKKKHNKCSDDIEKELLKIKKKTKNISFCGGEVTIRKDFFELIKCANKLEFKNIRIETNSRIFASIEFCKKTIDSGATEFLVSLHGFCSEQHDFLTKTQKSFSQTIKGIKNLINLEQKVSANIVITKPNYRNLSKIISLLDTLKIKKINLEFVNPLEDALENFEQVVPHYKIAAPYISKAIDKGIEKNIKVALSSVPFCILPGYEEHIKNNNFEGKSAKFKKCRTCQFENKCSGVSDKYIEKLGKREFGPLK